MQHGMLGGHMTTSVDASYLADNVDHVALFRRCAAEVRQAISVFKKRAEEVRAHHSRVQHYQQGHHGWSDTAWCLHGILTGVPTYVDDMLESESDLVPD